MSNKFPRSERAARRSLKFWDTEDGRVICGSMWLEIRIIGDTKAEATKAAIEVWRLAH